MKRSRKATNYTVYVICKSLYVMCCCVKLKIAQTIKIKIPTFLLLHGKNHERMQRKHHPSHFNKLSHVLLSSSADRTDMF